MRSVRDRVKDAFKRLRKHGVVARANFMCCSNCAGAELSTRNPDGTRVVFFHKQDNSRLDKGGNVLPGSKLYLSFGVTNGTNEAQITGVGRALEVALVSEGLKVEWNGSPHTRLAVTGVREEATE